MKILFIIENEKVIGGGDYYVFKFAENLAILGHNVEVFAAKRNEFYDGYKLPKNLKIDYRGKIPRLFKGSWIINWFWEKIYDFLVMKKFFRKNKDINFIFGYQRYSAIKADRICKRHNIKSVNFVFETPTWLEKKLKEEWTKSFNDKKLKNRRLKESWQQFEKTLLNSDIVLTDSNMARKSAEKWLNRKVHTIYPGIDLDVIEQVGNQKQKNQIIYVGRLYVHKNINEIITALSKIKNQPKFVICGDGREKGKLKRLAKKLKVNCEFKGRVTDYEKFVEIKKSLFMVFPTSLEGFGMPPMEALACGIPCICSDIPVLKEVYKGRVEYFKEHNIDNLKEKMMFLLNNLSYCKKRGQQGRLYIKKKFSWKKSAEKIERILINYEKA